jgi:hypothetical protein
MKAKYQFSQVVVVTGYFIGVIVKTWESSKTGLNYDVYVRSFNAIKNYQESEIRQFVYDKELTDEQLEFYE